MVTKNEAVAARARKHQAKRVPNGEVHEAWHDADVIHLISTEVDKRTRALHDMIADAAYFRAQKRGFKSGHELEDWLVAEQEIEQRLQP